MNPQAFPVTEAFRGMRLDRFLQEMLPRMSRASIQDAIATRVMLASGAEPKSSRRLVVGEIVTIAPREAAAMDDVVPAILAEGPGWLVIDKPAGLASTPSARRPGEDVATQLGLSPAHRLDRFTSGCLLLTRDAGTARFFEAAFRERRIEKEYVALVLGSPAADAFEIDAPLGPDASSRVPGKVAAGAAGSPACTRIEVIERLESRSLVHARPLTGRRHQVRAHLAHVGHPIVGDLLYGGDERRFIRLQLGQPVETPAGLVPGRHLLHASRLAFTDPSGERFAVEAPWPADLYRPA
jgi:RluA family pseudouridine synthase